MKLKNESSNTEYPGTEQLRMQDMGFFDKAEDKPRTGKYSTDYSRSGTNTGYAGSAITEWDSGIERNSFKITEDGAREALSKSKQEIRQKNYTIMKISEIILYISYAVVIYLFARACSGNNVNIYYNLKGCLLPFLIVYILTIADAVLVYCIDDKKLGLFVFSILLGFLYPLYRHRLVTGSLLGVVATILIVLASSMILANYIQAYNFYGGILKYESQPTREAISELYNQKGKKELPLAKTIQKRLTLQDASYEITKAGEQLTLIGDGTISVNQISTPGKDTIDTALVFTKEKGSEAFNLTGVTLNDATLNDYLVTEYWNSFVGNNY